MIQIQKIVIGNIEYKLFIGGVGGEMNSLPQITSFTLTPQLPLTIDTVTSTIQTTDADGDAVNLTYTWYLNGVEIVGETTMQLELNTIAGLNGGDVITLKAVPNDGTSNGPIAYEQVTIRSSLKNIEEIITTFNKAISKVSTECARLDTLNRILCMREKMLKK